MKSTEFITEDTIDDDMRDRTKRQARLKAEIEAGMMPTVQNVSSTTEPAYTMRDLEDLGWVEQEYTYDHDGEVDGWVRYYDHDAPGPIRVQSGKGEPAVWQPGHQED